MLPLTSFSVNKPSLLGNSVSNAGLKNTYVPKTHQGLVSSNTAKDFSQLIDFLKEAEQKLIVAGYKTISERIHIIRGIYYGTLWSVDYFVEGSGVRNGMFQAYTYSTVPLDPRSVIGQTLFKNLFDNPEVFQGTTKAVDFGHLMIGLDARLSFLARETAYPMHGGGTGLEICTWLGDLGGAVGMLSINRASAPSTRAISKFKGSSFGGWVNLEGDVAAFLVASDQSTFDSTPSINLEDGTFIADSLKSYLVSNPTEWNNRAKNFLKVLGAEVHPDTCEITNIDALKKSIASKIQNFGEVYMANRLRQNGSINIDTLINASSHLVGASKEITEIFIHTLSQTCKSPEKPLSASGIDPNPTPKGQPFAKYVALKKAQQAEKQAEDWINEIEDWFSNW